MLVLSSFLLVIVATVLLVLGVLTDDGGLNFIYFSIGLSVLAAILLVIAVRTAQPKEEPKAAPEPLTERERELATVGAPSVAEPTATATVVAPGAPPPPPPPPPDASAAATGAPPPPPPAAAEGEGEEWLVDEDDWVGPEG